MARLFKFRGLLPLGALALAALLAGCVAYPAYPGYYGGYYGGPYYGGGVVAFGGGWHDDWHDHDWGWRH